MTHRVRTFARVLSPRRLIALALALLALQWIHAVGQFGGPGVADFFGRWMYDAIVFVASLACLSRAVLGDRARAPWALLGAGLLSFAAGDFIYSLAPNLDAVPVPSISDPLWLAFYPCAYLALLLLGRERAGDALAATRLDGLISGVTVASVLACITLPLAESGTAGAPFWEYATNLAYPTADLVLFGAVVSTIALAGWRVDRPLAILGAAMVAWEVADVVYMFGVKTRLSDMTDALVLSGVVAMAIAAALDRGRPAVAPATAGDRGMFLPVGFGAGALAVLTIGVVAGLDTVGMLLAATALGLVLLRMALALAENRSLLGVSRTEATTDALTRLGNRRKLKYDLGRALEDGGRHALVLLDLNGFKTYNDTFGHAAGDALLARLGQSLSVSARAHGEAYRLGGDEFCVIAECAAGSADALGAQSAAALTARGEGFSISAAYGVAILPDEAQDASSALALADARMYGNKAMGGRTRAADQLANALAAVVEEHAPSLAEHQHAVRELAVAIAAALPVAEDEVEAIAHAAALHDIGKMAIPDSILSKSGPLTEDEREMLRRHPIVGERILAAAPALAFSARLVRSSHERVDGRGYPDGLTGEAIPLGSRIIAVADAYHQIARTGVGEADTLRRLRSGAGSALDARVIDALEQALSARPWDAHQSSSVHWVG